MKKIFFTPFFNQKLRIMRLTTCFLFLFSCFAFAGNVSSQNAKVSLNETQSQLKEVLNEIESQTDYLFLSNLSINLEQKVSIKAKNQSVQKVLDKLFAKTDLSYSVEGINIMLSKKAKSTVAIQQMENQITGVVTDRKTGETIIGATIQLKGTTIGVSTDFDGAFSIKAETSSVLVISFIGYNTKEITVGSNKVISIQLEENIEALEEVIVIGYGTQKKVNLTASVATVDIVEIQSRPVKSLAETLSASVPGLNVTYGTGGPTSEAKLNIRGFTGMNDDGATNEAPLVLVDNIPMDLRFVNPNDIESISVLKDAAASAIYGSRAPNGVILITTKSGKRNQKLSVTYDGSVQIGTPIGMHGSLNGYDYALYRNVGQYNVFKAATYSEETLEKLEQYVNGEIDYQNPILPNGKYAGVWDTHGSTDNFDLAFKKNVINTKHNVSINGGGEKISYYAGIGYTKNDGLYRSDHDWMKRYSTIFKVDADVTDWMKIGTRVNYNRQDSQRPRAGAGYGVDDGRMYSMLGFHATLPAYNDNGSINEFSMLPNVLGKAGTFDMTTHEILLNFNTEINPIKGISIKANYSYKLLSSHNVNSQLMFGGLDADGAFIASRRSPKSEFIEKQSSQTEYHNTNITVNYAREFGEHDISALVGFSEEVNKFGSFIANSSGVISHSNLSLSTTAGTVVTADDEMYSWATRGYFYRFSYNYGSRYLIDFNGRYDGASKYSPDTRWAFFPSVSVAYNIAQEEFWTFGEYVNMLKFKASFGKLGNTSSGGHYTYIPTLGIKDQTPIIIDNGRPKYVTMPGIISPDLTWTKPQTIGFGVEAALFGNRLQIDYGWYQRTVYDQLGPAQQLTEVLGANPPKQNNSVSETRGWDLSVKWNDRFGDLAGSPINYGVRAGVSDYIGYVVKYEGNDGGLRNSWTAGQRFGEINGYHGAGIGQSAQMLSQNPSSRGGWSYQGDYMFKDLNGDGLINTGEGGVWYANGDRALLGYSYPRYRYNFNLSLDWKGFSMSALFDGVGSQKKYVANKMTMGSQEYTSPDVYELGGYWNLDNTDAFFPRSYSDPTLGLRGLNNANDQYIFDLSHLRIKNIYLGYSLPKRWLPSTVVKSFLVYCSVENAGLVYSKSWNKNLDPLHIMNSATNYPPQRTFSFGVKVRL